MASQRVVRRVGVCRVEAEEDLGRGVRAVVVVEGVVVGLEEGLVGVLEGEEEESPGSGNSLGCLRVETIVE